ncbi:FAD-binding oxidoreductase [Catellatospora aurea]|uniref:FAD-binding oxidoreductase n=1 Tax=Catellatospora aurea TaxID=1337874 RepID=A0ABW2GT85_9ACTN
MGGATGRERSWWGWGWADQAVDADGCAKLARRVGPFLPLDGELTPVPAVPELPPSRLRPPASIAALCRDDARTRAAHAYGRAYRDVVRLLHGALDNPPDLVAYPRDEQDVIAVLDWAADTGTPVVPFGGGTSVVGGVEYRGGGPWLSLDLTGLSGVVEVDEVSRAALIRGGTFGPDLADALRPYGLTLRHFPQSFEFSTFGGWLATRAGGHYATGYTHIDDLVESMRVVTPAGIAQSLRVPASGAGPSPDRFWLGSEGALGVITEGWARVQQRPTFRAGSALRFSGYADAVRAVRAVAQSGLRPANCRLLDPLEAMLGAAVADGSSRLLLGFESADHPVDALLARAVELCRDHGGVAEDAAQDSTGRWRDTFVGAPYLRDGLARLGVVVETFETACTWAAFEALHAAVIEAVAAAGESETGSPALVTCRFTHVYPDGPAPYFTVYAAGRRGGEVAIWDALKRAAGDAIAANGGTITHHHAVGRDHLPWYTGQRPEPFALALRSAKSAVDPAGVLNPGVLLP